MLRVPGTLCLAWALGLAQAVLTVERDLPQEVAALAATARRAQKAAASSGLRGIDDFLGPYALGAQASAARLPDSRPSAAWGDDKFKAVLAHGLHKEGLRVAGYASGGSDGAARTHGLFGLGYQGMEGNQLGLPPAGTILSAAKTSPEDTELVGAVPSSQGGGMDYARFKMHVDKSHLGAELMPWAQGNAAKQAHTKAPAQRAPAQQQVQAKPQVQQQPQKQPQQKAPATPQVQQQPQKQPQQKAPATPQVQQQPQKQQPQQKAPATPQVQQKPQQQAQAKPQVPQQQVPAQPRQLQTQPRQQPQVPAQPQPREQPQPQKQQQPGGQAQGKAASLYSEQKQEGWETLNEDVKELAIYNLKLMLLNFTHESAFAWSAMRMWCFQAEHRISAEEEVKQLQNLEGTWRITKDLDHVDYTGTVRVIKGGRILEPWGPGTESLKLRAYIEDRYAAIIPLPFQADNSTVPLYKTFERVGNAIKWDGGNLWERVQAAAPPALPATAGNLLAKLGQALRGPPPSSSPKQAAAPPAVPDWLRRLGQAAAPALSRGAAAAKDAPRPAVPDWLRSLAQAAKARAAQGA